MPEAATELMLKCQRRVPLGLRTEAPREVRGWRSPVPGRAGVSAPGGSPALSCSIATKARHKSWGVFPAVTRCHCRKKPDQKIDARERGINVLDPKEVVALATGST